MDQDYYEWLSIFNRCSHPPHSSDLDEMACHNELRRGETNLPALSGGPALVGEGAADTCGHSWPGAGTSGQAAGDASAAYPPYPHPNSNDNYWPTTSDRTAKHLMVQPPHGELPRPVVPDGPAPPPRRDTPAPSGSLRPPAGGADSLQNEHLANPASRTRYGNQLNTSQAWDPCSMDSLLPSPSDLLEGLYDVGECRQPSLQQRPASFFDYRRPPAYSSGMVGRAPDTAADATNMSAASDLQLTCSMPVLPAFHSQPNDLARSTAEAADDQRANRRRSSETSVTVHAPILANGDIEENRTHWGGLVTVHSPASNNREQYRPMSVLERPQPEPSTSLGAFLSSPFDREKNSQPYPIQPFSAAQSSARNPSQRKTPVQRGSANTGTAFPRPAKIPSASPTLKRLRQDVCQVTTCGSDLTGSKSYNRRYKLCAACMKLSSVVVNSREMRFCQQCSCLHPIADFDGKKRSCRDQLNKHKARRREREICKTNIEESGSF